MQNSHKGSLTKLGQLSIFFSLKERFLSTINFSMDSLPKNTGIPVFLSIRNSTRGILEKVVVPS